MVNHNCGLTMVAVVKFKGTLVGIAFFSRIHNQKLSDKNELRRGYLVRMQNFSEN